MPGDLSATHTSDYGNFKISMRIKTFFVCMQTITSYSQKARENKEKKGIWFGRPAK